MTERLLSLLIGYIPGCFLTAEVVSRAVAGRGTAELGGTGNPGMANIMSLLGFRAGIAVLAGDLGKCALAAAVSWLLFRGRIYMLWAGLGCTLGHDFPFWRKFRGGKGVATSSIAIAIYAFLPGLLANIAGMLVVFATKYLCIGGPVIPLVFAAIMFFRGDAEAGALSLVFFALALCAHASSIRGIRSGDTEKTDVIGKLKGKFGRKA